MLQTASLGTLELHLPTVEDVAQVVLDNIQEIFQIKVHTAEEVY